MSQNSHLELELVGSCWSWGALALRAGVRAILQAVTTMTRYKQSRRLWGMYHAEAYHWSAYLPLLKSQVWKKVSWLEVACKIMIGGWMKITMHVHIFWKLDMKLSWMTCQRLYLENLCWILLYLSMVNFNLSTPLLGNYVLNIPICSSLG